MDPLLSVIIPVYNVQQYLGKCIDSVLSQTYTDFEVILVDDGATDGSENICDEYAKKDSRVMVIHKINGGLSDARNAGLYRAKGKYISFIDSDDYIVNNAYEVMLDKIIENDLDIICGYPITCLEDGFTKYEAKRRSLENKVYSGEDYLCQCLKEHSMLWAVQFNIYKADLIKENALLFKKGALHEDTLWTPQIFLIAQKVMCINIGFYYYIMRSNSITHSKCKTKNGVDILNHCYELENICNRVENTANRRILNDNLVELFLNGFYIGRLCYKEHAKDVRKSFVGGKAYSLRNRFKVALFLVNKRLYIKINDVSKK